MKGSRLNLVIRANSVELHDNGATQDSIVKSVKIQKGDVETALKECYIFLNENKNLQTDINLSIPNEHIKFFIKHIDRKNDEDNVNLIAKHFLKNEKNIEISKILYSIVEISIFFSFFRKFSATNLILSSSPFPSMCFIKNFMCSLGIERLISVRKLLFLFKKI